MKIDEKIKKAKTYMEAEEASCGSGCWFSPTEIGKAVGGIKKHSSYGSPICKKMVELGIAERNEKGHYRLINQEDIVIEKGLFDE